MTWRCVDALQRFPPIRLAIADSLSRNKQSRWVACRKHAHGHGMMIMLHYQMAEWYGMHVPGLVPRYPRSRRSMFYSDSCLATSGDCDAPPGHTRCVGEGGFA